MEFNGSPWIKLAIWQQRINKELKSQDKQRYRKTSPNICTDGQTKPVGCTRVNLKQRPDTSFLPVSLCLNLYENVLHNVHESPLGSRELETKRRSARLICSLVVVLTNKIIIQNHQFYHDPAHLTHQTEHSLSGSHWSSIFLLLADHNQRYSGKYLPYDHRFHLDPSMDWGRCQVCF